MPQRHSPVSPRCSSPKALRRWPSRWRRSSPGLPVQPHPGAGDHLRQERPPRIAALLDVAQISDIVAVVDAETFVRPIYAGSALATVRSSDLIKVVTVRPSAFDPVGTAAAPPRSSPECYRPARVRVTCDPSSASAPGPSSPRRGSSSPAARRWLGENFALVEALADQLGAAVGASRAAVDCFAPTTFRSARPEGRSARALIAIGISGAIQHLAGMKDPRSSSPSTRTRRRRSSRSPTMASSATCSRSSRNSRSARMTPSQHRDGARVPPETRTTGRASAPSGCSSFSAKLVNGIRQR